MTTPVPSQLTEHQASRVSYAGPAGPLAALHRRAIGNRLATAVLLPGFTGSKEDFAPLIEPIATAGIEVIALDLPGQFDSPGPDDEAEYLPLPLGATVAELLDKLAGEGRRILLLGHSYGGLVARAALLADAPVIGLTLLDSGPAALPDGQRRRLVELGESVLRTEGIEAANTLRVGTSEPTLPRPVAELHSRRFLATDVSCLLGMSTGLRYEPDRTTELATALRAGAMGCLVMCGAADDAWPPSVQQDMAERLDTDFAIIPNAGHSPNVENPQGLLARLLPTWSTWMADAATG
ncbi:MAG: alpha/beta fold hydrolase [Sciscionella sp.]